MKMIVVAVMMLSMISVTFYQIRRNRRMKSLAEDHTKVAPFVMISASLVLISEMSVSAFSASWYVMTADIMPSVLGMWILASSVSEHTFAKWSAWILVAVNMLFISFHICRMAGVREEMSDRHAVMLVSLTTLVLMAVFMWLNFARMKNIRSFIGNGGVWTNVCLVVEVAYLCFILIAAAMLQSASPVAGFLISGGALLAMGVRITNDSKFLIWQSQERRIVESMRATPMSSVADASRLDEIYKDLYERIVDYFEAEKPYLDGELTINLLVKELYSNKMYISRAISHFTGRNFCQFVNYYRVVHSMESFRNNPDLKVHELAAMSGFNTIVSYNMAFRLFMGENPSEWCRKEKSRLIKKGK